ncbi:UNVERIFIED_CONTAM: hypothetical protein RMT77_007932 [Armadillidium vulgare]
MSFARVIESLSLALLLLGTAIPASNGLPQSGGSGSGSAGGGSNVDAQLSQYGYEHVGGNKYATVVSGYTTWFGAYAACQKHLPGASLFLVNSAEDSHWLGTRINYQKDRVNGASKFWVGLISRSANGPLQWLDGSHYQNHKEVVQVSGYDDNTKKYAWAVPDSFTRLKYEFLTFDDEAESYICQYIKQ